MADHLKFFHGLETPIALVGLGISNVAVRRLLIHLGVPSGEIVLFDSTGKTGAVTDPDDLGRAGVKSLVVSPGFPLATPWIQSFKARGVEVTSEIDFAARFLENECVIAVTGSLGKSTTTSLIGEGLRASGRPFFIGGNLGYPLADYILACLQGLRPRAHIIALELSSFQLECASHLPIDYGLVTYFCSNHLERYESLEQYYDVKSLVLRRAKNGSFVNAGSRELLDYLERHPELGDRRIQSVRVGSGKFSIKELEQKVLVGEHNAENIELAAHVLSEVGVLDEPVRRALLNFAGLPHRMERLKGLDSDLVFINDSKATALESVLTAVRSILTDQAFNLNSTRKLICFFGGRDKKHPWEKLGALRSEAARLEVVFFGECAVEARRRSGLAARSFPTLRLAMENVRADCPPDAWIVLSPGGTSLDEFKNFEDRGEKFGAWARELWGNDQFEKS